LIDDLVGNRIVLLKIGFMKAQNVKVSPEDKTVF